MSELKRWRHEASSTHRFPRYCVSSVEGYRHFEKHPVSYDIECFKMAATYSPTMQRSTIGDAELNDPVRNGKGWDLSAITT